MIARGTSVSGQVRGGERHAQAAAQASIITTCVCARLLGKEFGVAGKGDAGVVDDALLHRRGDHGVVFAREAASEREVEHREHIAAVAGVELPGTRGRERGTCSISGKPASRARSPTATSRAGKRSAASRTQSSGPIPAGSPEVSAMTGRAAIAPPAAAPRRTGRGAASAIPGRRPRSCARAAPCAPRGAGAPG